MRERHEAATRASMLTAGVKTVLKRVFTPYRKITGFFKIAALLKLSRCKTRAAEIVESVGKKKSPHYYPHILDDLTTQLHHSSPAASLFTFKAATYTRSRKGHALPAGEGLGAAS